LVDLTRCFVLLCPVDDPVFEAGRVVVVVVVADGGYCGFGCGLGNVLAQTDYGLELYRCGGKPNRYGQSEMPPSKSTVTSGVWTRVHMERTPKLSDASGVTLIVLSRLLFCIVRSYY
jgi:hypothetical protein